MYVIKKSVHQKIALGSDPRWKLKYKLRNKPMTVTDVKTSPLSINNNDNGVAMRPCPKPTMP